MRKFITQCCCVAMLALTSCGSATKSAGGADFFEAIAARVSSVSRTPAPYRSVDEAMPNVEFVIDGKGSNYIAEGFVLGTVSDIVAGKSFRWDSAEDGNGDTRVEIPYGATDAMISTVHITVTVERSITAPDTTRTIGSSVVLGVAFPPSSAVESARASLLGKRVVALLRADSLVFDYDPTLWAVLEDGSMIGLVEGKNQVVFPALVNDDKPVKIPLSKLDNKRSIKVKKNSDGGYTRE